MENEQFDFDGQMVDMNSVEIAVGHSHEEAALVMHYKMDARKMSSERGIGELETKEFDIFIPQVMLPELLLEVMAATMCLDMGEEKDNDRPDPSHN